MKERGQAAMEFLTTYGWAIIILVIVVSVLYVMGIFNPSGGLPNSITFPAGFSAYSYKVVEGGGALLDLGQNTGNPILVTAVACSAEETPAVPALPLPIRIESGSHRGISVQCKRSDGSTDLKLNEHYKGRIYVNYTNLRTQMPHVISGEISYRVEPWAPDWVATLTPTPEITATPNATPTASPANPGWISGLVVDEGGTAVFDATVTAVGESSGSDITDVDGYYQIYGLQPGEYSVTARKGTFGTTVVATVEAEAPTILNLMALPPCSDGTPNGNCSATKPLYCLNMTLSENCAMCGCPLNYTCNSTSGRCYFSAQTPTPTPSPTPTPAPCETMNISCSGGFCANGSCIATAITCVCCGDAVCNTARGETSANCPLDCMAQTPSPTPTPTQTPTPAPMGWFYGRVTNANGTGLPGAAVNATGPSSGSNTTDSGGYYYVYNLPAGTYNLSAHKSGYQAGYGSGTIYAGNLTAVNFQLTATCGDGTCISGLETYSSCPIDCCESDCTSKTDSVCHFSCNGYNGCAISATCDGTSSGAYACASGTSRVLCCEGSAASCGTVSTNCTAYCSGNVTRCTYPSGTATCSKTCSSGSCLSCAPSCGTANCTACSDGNACTIDSCSGGACAYSNYGCGTQPTGCTGSYACNLGNCTPKLGANMTCACNGICLSGNCTFGICM